MKLFCKLSLKFLFTVLCVLLYLSTTYSKNLLSEMSNLNLESETDLSKFEEEQVYQSVPYPQGISNMILAYTYVYPDDKVKYVTLDSITVDDGNIIIYKPTPDGDTTRVIISLQELSWLCGKSLLCKPEEAAEKFNPKGKLQKLDFKNKMKMLYRRLGPNSTNCVADEYNFGIIQKALVICFLNRAKEVEFNNKFTGLKKKETESAAIIALDTKKSETYLLSFSDGREALVDKEVTFKSDGLYEKTNILFKYNELETIDGEKCMIKYRLPVAPTNFIGKKIFDKNCIVRLRYNRLDTYIGSATPNCEEVIKYTISKMKSSCNAMKNGLNDMLRNALKANPTEGEWSGWVFHHKILAEKNEVTNLMFKLLISPEKVSLLDKTGHEVRVIELNTITWPCNNDGACNIPEWVRYLKEKNQKVEFYDKLLKDMKSQWHVQDTNSCFVLNESEKNIICPTDNSEELLTSCTTPLQFLL